MRIDTNKSILVIGSGPIIVGQSCEFDYSGTQGCKALKEAGYRVILINSNPATVMTDNDICDATYIEPMTVDVIEKIIQKEKPNYLLPTLGGQTALNLAIKLYEEAVLKKYDIELIGANYNSIKKAEDRDIFSKLVKNLGYKIPISMVVNNIKDAQKAKDELGLPCIVRNSFSLGGNLSGIAYNKTDFSELCNKIFKFNKVQEIYIDESIIGYKEYELEIVRDKADNCIVVCSIENLNPLGVHTGDSITIAPAQTLTDFEYQKMRDIAFRIIREIGIDTGGANIQFAVNPLNGEIFVIEVNPRVSRSSALASKATGFPIAKIAALLAVGFTLDQLKNEITDNLIPASFEPAIDYVVTKIPKFCFEKFPNTSNILDTQMRSFGEVMAIGRNFQESLQKAILALEEEHDGVLSTKIIEAKLDDIKLPTPNLIFYIARLLYNEQRIDIIQDITKIDFWFLNKIKQIVELEKKYSNEKLHDLDFDDIFKLKRYGFSDQKIANITKSSLEEVRSTRRKLGINPVYKRIDSCAAEFDTSTCYMYSTYDYECESRPTNNKKIIILGSGPNRLGQSIEFDYSCTHASMSLKNLGYEVIMINSNPETISTDFNVSDRLYFEPICLENILEIVKIEDPIGVLFQFGGQTPFRLVKELKDNGVSLLGTNLESINLTEDRELFQIFLKQLEIPTYFSKRISDKNEIEELNNKFPLIIRPSYVIGGESIKIVNNKNKLIEYIGDDNYLNNNINFFAESFVKNALEIDIDIVYNGREIIYCGILEQFEQTGIHSGDSKAIFPTISLDNDTTTKIKYYSKKIITSLNAIGPSNIQFAVRGKEVFIIEVNLRSSRTIPFLSKAKGIDFTDLAIKSIFEKPIILYNDLKIDTPSKFYIKNPVFSLSKFSEDDNKLGPFMKSTGESMSIGKTAEESYLKALFPEIFAMTKRYKILIKNLDIENAKLLLDSSNLKINFDFFLTKELADQLKRDKNIKIAKNDILYDVIIDINHPGLNQVKPHLNYKYHNKIDNLRELLLLRKLPLVKASFNPI